jgi:hypothetical protein
MFSSPQQWEKVFHLWKCSRILLSMEKRALKEGDNKDP